MRTGILGGTFNPPHLGHLHAAELAKDALHLDKVLFIPTNIPPHKAMPAHTATAADRCEMVRLMIAACRGRSSTGLRSSAAARAIRSTRCTSCASGAKTTCT